MTIWGPHTDFGLSSDELREAVDTHLASHIGDHETAYCDEEGWAGQSSEDGPPVDVLVVPPEGERRFAYVATFGCALASLGNETYRDMGVERRVEFVLAAQQPEDHEESHKSLNLAANTVRQFAKMVHLNGVTVEPGETVAFSNEPRPIYDEAEFCGFVFMPPRLPGPGFEELYPSNAGLGEPLRYVAPVPIHEAELEFGIMQGSAALVELFMRAGVTEMIDMGRPCLIKTRQDLVEQISVPIKDERAKSPEDATPAAAKEGKTAKRKGHWVDPKSRAPIRTPKTTQEKVGVFNWLLSLIGIR